MSLKLILKSLLAASITTRVKSSWSWSLSDTVRALEDPEGLGRTDRNATDFWGRSIEDTKSMLVALGCFKVNNCHLKPLYYYRALRNYGCNCYPGNYDKKNIITDEMMWNFGGNGQPVDELDNACLKAFSNYRCFRYDLMENNFKKFNVVYGPYEKCHFGVPFEYHMGKNGGIICGPDSNPGYRYNRAENACKLYACNIERDFANNAFAILQNAPGDYARANIQNFNLGIEGKCVKKNNVNTSRDMCCGNYPNRFPYDSNKEDCCAGKVTSIGAC